jgi:hypothetical protein
MRNELRVTASLLVIQITEARAAGALNRLQTEEIMNALIDIIGLLAVLANALFALHVWSAVSARAHRHIRTR